MLSFVLKGCNPPTPELKRWFELNVFWVLAAITVSAAVIALYKFDSTRAYLTLAGFCVLFTVLAVNLGVPPEGRVVITNVIGFDGFCVLDVDVTKRGEIAFISWSDTISIPSEECKEILETGKHHSYNEYLQWKGGLT